MAGNGSQPDYTSRIVGGGGRGEGDLRVSVYTGAPVTQTLINSENGRNFCSHRRK